MTEVWFRQTDPRYPFLWESPHQPGGRWHGEDEGPVQYLASSPDGAWAEFLRHEEIRDMADVAGIERSLWAVELDEPPGAMPELDEAILTGPPTTWVPCRAEADRLRATGATGLLAPSAALIDSADTPWRSTEGHLAQSDPRPAAVAVFFGPRPDLEAWLTTDESSPPRHILERVHHYAASGADS